MFTMNRHCPVYCQDELTLPPDKPHEIIQSRNSVRVSGLTAKQFSPEVLPLTAVYSGVNSIPDGSVAERYIMV